MLKLNYTEIGLYMERTLTALEMLVAQQVVLAVRSGQSLWIEQSQASFLLPADLPELAQLTLLLPGPGDSVAISPVDHGWIEVSLSGSWVAESREAHAGTFLVVLSDPVEGLIYQLWQMSQTDCASLERYSSN